MVTVTRIGTVLALCVTLAACGEPAAKQDAGATTAPAAVAESELAASPVPPAAPSTGTTARATPAPRTTAPRPPAGTTAPVTVRFSHPLPLERPNPGPFTGLHQETCGGDPDRALVTISIADPERRPLPVYDYHVQTPVPFRGTFTGLSMSNGGATWGGLLGPFRADPANAAGGTITVTVRVSYADGSTRTTTASTVLKPCQR